MILNKQVGVFLNIVHYEFKTYINSVFQDHKFDLTPEQYLVMDTLWDDGILSQQEIANTLIKDKNSVTKLINSLESKGLVVRKVKEDDRRQKLIHLTQKGEALKDDATVIAIDSTDAIMAGIPVKDLENFVTVLKQMSKNIDELKNSSK